VTDIDLRQLVTDTAPQDLPALAGRLREAELLAEMRLRVEASGNGHRPEPEREIEVWITPEAAAVIPGVPKERIYSWAKGQRWASRPTRRCLRIEEKGFRRWLATKGR
jgi:hypothetical protein